MQRSIFTLALAAMCLLASCSGGSEDTTGLVPGSSSQMQLLSCSLACSDGVGTAQGCGISDVFVNQTIAFEFNRPVDESSLSSTTLKVSELATGSVPPARIEVDPGNARRVLYRPLVSFDDFGNLIPGLKSGASYRIFVPGTGSNRIRSTSGSLNTTTVDCFIVASLGVLDLQPGPPKAEVLVEVFDPSTSATIDQFDADGAIDVPLTSRIRIQFDQLMDPASILSTVTGQSPSVSVRLDEDGLLSTLGDQIPIPGTFVLQYDQFEDTTALVFRPEPSMPSAGIDLLEPHRVIVEVTSAARDFAGEPLVQPPSALFTPLAVPLDPEVVLDRFVGIEPTNTNATSAQLEPSQLIGDTGFRGRVLPVLGGGSGRHGELIVRSGETVVLGTGPSLVTRFGVLLETGAVDAAGVATADPDDIAAYHVQAEPLDDYRANGVAPGELPVVVDDGVFEFAQLVIEPGGRVTFEGANPPRVFVRGACLVRGTLDASGRDAGEQASTVGLGGDGGTNRLGAGAGGDGGDRPNQPSGGQLTPTQGPNFRGFVHPDGTVVDTNGAPGAGRGGAAVGTDGAGGGGSAWPPIFPGPSIVQLGTIDNATFLNDLCASVIVGGPGAGGSHATAGTAPVYSVPSPAFGAPPAPPAASPDATLVRAFEVVLDPDRGGALVGGAGGGGGGAGMQGTTTNGVPTNSCIPGGLFPIKQVTAYLDASGGAGGGGGGAMQLSVGGLLEVRGIVDASGGEGGGFGFCPNPLASDPCWAAPGGGGSGGALLVQAKELDLSDSGPSFDVSGGTGGLNANTLSIGGAGGAGMIQIETPTALAPSAVAAELLPAVGGAMQPATADVILTAPLADPLVGPARRSGFTTCWRLPEGGLFGFDFAEDDLTAVDPSEWSYGWNAWVELDTGEVVQWRGDSGPIDAEFGSDLETLMGSQLGSSPLVVRFQGVRFGAIPLDPCSSDAEVAGGGMVEDSFTPWVEHPAELNGYWGTVVSQFEADARRPNAIRAQVVFDPDAPLAERIVSVVQIEIVVQPL